MALPSIGFCAPRLDGAAPTWQPQFEPSCPPPFGRPAHPCKTSNGSNEWNMSATLRSFSGDITSSESTKERVVPDARRAAALRAHAWFRRVL
eukprot:4855398-Prymnesium_polylepis.1